MCSLIHAKAQLPINLFDKVPGGPRFGHMAENYGNHEFSEIRPENHGFGHESGGIS